MHFVNIGAAAAAIVLTAQIAIAGTIGFRTDAEVKAGPGLDVKVTMTHTGDETAGDVSLRAELDDHVVQGEKVASIRPGASHVWNLHLVDEIPKGIYAITLRARYADANGYMFETVSLAAAPVGVEPAAKLFGSLEVPGLTVDGTADARISVKKPPTRSGTFHVTLVMPEGLEASPNRVSLEFDQYGKATANFAVRNRKLLAGTSLNIFGFITGSDPGFPQVDTIRGTVRIGTSKARVTSPMFYQGAIAMLLLLAVLEGYAWARGPREPASE